MIEMIKLPSAAKRLQCIAYKQQFRGRYSDVKDNIVLLEKACDDVKMSMKLKKVLKTILKVGNQMNDGAKNIGFTVDSLLKLQHAKAFDKKTSILQYVVTLISRNDESCLEFPLELSSVADASKISMDMLIGDRNQLIDMQNSCSSTLATLIEEDGSVGSKLHMTNFLDKVRMSVCLSVCS